MDLIDKIKAILLDSDLNSPSIDLHFDNQGNVVGYVTDDFFIDKNDEEAQRFIWNNLRKNLEHPELIKILSIFHETPVERIGRLSNLDSKKLTKSNFWIHETPDLTKFWLFIDVARFEENYKAFFLIVNQKDKYRKGLTFDYNKEVIEFMELSDGEVYDELFSNAFNNAEAEIKFHLMTKHERLNEKGLWGRANMFHYVFEDFKLTPIIKAQLLFNSEEIKLISESLTKIDDFSAKSEIESAIENSKIVNRSSREL